MRLYDMIGFLLFITVTLLAVSLFICPPDWNKDGRVYMSSFTKLMIKLVFSLTMLYWLVS